MLLLILFKPPQFHRINKADMSALLIVYHMSIKSTSFNQQGMVSIRWITATLPNQCSTIPLYNISKSVERKERISRLVIPWSPNMTLLDFIIWGYIKSIVYKTARDDLVDLRRRRLFEIKKIIAEMLYNVRKHCCL